MKTKRWAIGWFAIVAIALAIIGMLVYYVDPFFHYHKPHTDKYFYTLDNQRSQNFGISKYFDCDAVITGTSMTENFKTSDLDKMFGVNSIKLPFSGASYKEINDNLINALANNQNLKMIVRGLDPGMFFDDPDLVRKDLGVYPTYLYDNNPFNDVYYLFNKDVLFNRVYAMTQAKDEEYFKPGITLFDNYSRWQDTATFGVNTIAPDGVTFDGLGKMIHMSDEGKKTVYENITQNVTSLADEYPDVEFYYFFTPYSIIWHKLTCEYGTVYNQIEAEQYVIELILEHENIKLFSFNGCEDIITDLNNYKDEAHYAAWVNSYILRCMHDNKYRLTKDNYQEYLNKELDLILNYDFDSLNEKEDYENDLYSAALMNEKIWNVKPVDVLTECAKSVELSNAEVISNQFAGKTGIRCLGNLQRESGSEVPVADYIQNCDYIGAKITINSIGDYNYLVFYGKKTADNAQPTVVVFDSNNNKVGEIEASYQDLDTQWHQYVIDLSSVDGDITIYFNGGYIDNTGSPESEYVFSNITLY